MLSYNIHAGISYHHYGHYLTRSWWPRGRIDHILVTPEIRIRRSFVPPWHYSDHLPIAMEVILPAPF
ncbi:MAG: hypothetical protein V3R72_04550 [Gammaproteobacteria bacterium]